MCPPNRHKEWPGIPTFQFTLVTEGPDLQADLLVDALFEAGCDDALVGRAEGVQYLEFDRQAPSLPEAVFSAISDVEAVEGVAVVRLAGAGLVSVGGVAARTGERARGCGAFLNRGVVETCRHHVT